MGTDQVGEKCYRIILCDEPVVVETSPGLSFREDGTTNDAERHPACL